MKNRILIFGMMLGFIAFLTGCHPDEKQATQINEKMDKAASFEKEFADSQKDLEKSRKKAQTIYNDLISLDINDDKDGIKEKLDEANTYIEKQRKLIKEAEDNFQKAYEKTEPIEENVKKIKDEKQKNQAAKLLALMNDRKELIGSFFDEYQDQLKLQSTFYEEIENAEFNLDKLDKQINTINEYSQNMGEIIQQFNQNTDQFNEVEDEYYEMAGFKTSHDEKIM